MTSGHDEKPFDPNDYLEESVGEEGRKAPRAVRFSMGSTEFIKTGLSLFDPHDPYYFAVSLSWSRFFLLFVAAEVSINTLFAGLYMLQPAAIANQQTPGFLSAFFFSLETLATVGYGEMYPGSVYGHVVSSLEIMTGVIFMAIMTGLLFVRFSKPKAKIVYADHPVVATHNGKPTLMLRIGNARANAIYDAQAFLYTLVRTTSEEGHIHASIVDLPLLRPRSPVFAIMWTLMHIVDADSPVQAVLDDPQAAKDLRFFFTISGRDSAVGQEVTDVRTFFGRDVLVGMRYADAIKTEGQQRVVADYARLSRVEPDTAAGRTEPRDERLDAETA